MKLIKSISLASLSLWGNRSRVVFSMTGVVIGMVAILLLCSIVVSAKNTVVRQMGGLGANQILVVPGRVLDSPDGQKDFLGGITSVPSTLTYEDAKAVEKIPNVKSVTPVVESVTTIESPDNPQQQKVQAILLGSTIQYQQNMHTSLAEGRFFSIEEQQSSQKVVVLGSSIHQALINKKNTAVKGSTNLSNIEDKQWWETLLQWITGESKVEADTIPEETSLVGRNVLINGEFFKVVGVLESMAVLGTTTNNNIIMPIETAFTTTNVKNLNKIVIESSTLDKIDQVDGDAFGAIHQLHKNIDFSVIKQQQMLQAINKVTGIMQITLLGVTVTALFISGSGIMNTMIMSIRERTREIGIRKALGATTMEIMYQFFFETMLLCFFGSVIGLCFALGIIELWNANITTFPLSLPMWGVKIAIFSSIGVGGIFGIYPAIKAARLQPSEALRFE
jgi:putative ABC transport system permease protein